MISVISPSGGTKSAGPRSNVAVFIAYSAPRSCSSREINQSVSEAKGAVALEGPWVDVEGALAVDRYLLAPRGSRVLLRKESCLPK